MLKTLQNRTYSEPWSILLMVQKSGGHQSRLVVYPIIDRVYISQVVSRNSSINLGVVFVCQ